LLYFFCRRFLPRWFVVHANAQEVERMSVTLRSLSDYELLSRTKVLTHGERSATLGVLLHLNEIERRKLHLKQGYASMFAYCTRGLGYSESAANLRIRTARCLARFPEVYGLLDAGEVNPSTISQVSKILTPENRDVLARIRNKSQREVETIVAEYDARAALPADRVRTVVVRIPAPASTAQAAVQAPGAGNDWQEIYRCNSGARGDTPGAREAAEHVPPGETSNIMVEEALGTGPASPTELLETRKVFKFTATGDFEKKFAKIKSLASHRLPPNPSFEQVFELAMDCFLEREDPAARAGRRAKRNEPAQGPEVNRTGRDNPRYISPVLRDRVFVRDQGSCSSKGPDGKRCGSTYALQVDHITPVARGGRSTADNLRLLCAHHNRLEAERLMGVRAPRPTSPSISAR
jgi:5-methylcytosine-specific restriction endonuclease McrA